MKIEFSRQTAEKQKQITNFFTFFQGEMSCLMRTEGQTRLS